MSPFWLMTGCANAFISVAAGAFAAHGLRHRMASEALAAFETAARYQMYHAVGLIAVAWLCTASPSRAAHAAGWAFTIGIVLFSGSLYALCLTGLRKLGIITPFGGTAFLLGWVLLAAAAWRARR